ncbi:MAG: DUF6125 family protein [Acidobacteriota bacterium]
MPEPERALAMLGRLMLAWDGQWFLKTAEACGLQKAVELNARVRRSFARIEVREYLAALGRGPASDLEEAARLLTAYSRLFLGDGMDGEWKVEGGTAEIAVTLCRPQDGARRAGLKLDTPCIACEGLWGAWLEAILPGTAWETRIEAARGRGADTCRIVVRQKERDQPKREGS